nr:MAG TPA: hypothetical protein [Caudoviricetes sp.]
MHNRSCFVPQSTLFVLRCCLIFRQSVWLGFTPANILCDTTRI